MRFMLIQSYGRSASKPISSWSSDEIRAHIKFQQRLNVELTERGELVDAQGLSGPDQAKFVVSNGSGAPGRHRRAVRREKGAAGRLPGSSHPPDARAPRAVDCLLLRARRGEAQPLVTPWRRIQ